MPKKTKEIAEMEDKQNRRENRFANLRIAAALSVGVILLYVMIPICLCQTDYTYFVVNYLATMRVEKIQIIDNNAFVTVRRESPISDGQAKQNLLEINSRLPKNKVFPIESKAKQLHWPVSFGGELFVQVHLRNREEFLKDLEIIMESLEASEEHKFRIIK